MEHIKFEFLEHTADMKFQAFGSSLEEAFKNSALAMKEAISGKLKIEKKIVKKIEIKGKDLVGLLYRFLEEFLFMLDAENFLLAKINKIKIRGNLLEAEVAGDKASKYKFTNEVKAVTYNEMFVKKQRDRFVCQVVLDV